MPIAIKDIEAGWVYRTANNQERLVLGRDKDNRVVYVSRGGNVKNPFNGGHTRCGEETFAKKCEAKVRQVANLPSFIQANNASTIIL